MKIEFITRRDFNLLNELSSLMGYICESDTLKLPEKFGDGFIKIVDLEPGLKLAIHRHKLKEELIIKRNSSGKKNSLITITFNTMDRPIVHIQGTAGTADINLSSIYITSTDIGIETKFPVNKNINSTIIIIHTHVLSTLLEVHNNNRLIRNITTGNQSFWCDTDMTPKIQEILFQMDDPVGDKHFTNLFYRIKIQQLIYELFVELLEKENRPAQALKAADIEKMYLIRETVLSSLNSPPALGELARKVCMSETKMKTLFRQIFGKSIYNYYQVSRMDEAAKLLKDFSVRETGYRLGFINPSYFSQLFEKYHKLRPKKFKKLITSNKNNLSIQND